MRNYFFILAILPAILLSCINEPEDNANKPGNDVKTGDTLPAFTIYGATDDVVLRSSDFVGKQSLLLLFDITCPYCRETLPKINRVWENLKDDPACIVAAFSRGASSTRNEDIEATLSHWAEHALALPLYFDNNRAVFDLFATAGVPRIYVIDPQGVVQWMVAGSTDLSAEELTELVKSTKAQ
jgi:peroxiredoxin